jgi:polysaccharide export outer membrane protein
MRQSTRSLTLAVLVGCAIPLASLTAQTPASTSATVQVADARLQPGDVVRITVWRQPELSGDFRILQNGTIGHPLYQSVTAANTPMPELTQRIRTFLTTLVNDPQVVVEPLVSVAVGGEVRTPGLYTLPLGTTISQAIAQAGGGGDEGSLKNIRLIRNGQREVINLTDTRVNRGSQPVRSGDQIFVSRRGNSFRDIIGPLASVMAAIAAIVTVSSQ